MTLIPKTYLNQLRGTKIIEPDGGIFSLAYFLESPPNPNAWFVTSDKMPNGTCLDSDGTDITSGVLSMVGCMARILRGSAEAKGSDSLIVNVLDIYGENLSTFNADSVQFWIDMLLHATSIEGTSNYQRYTIINEELETS